MSIQIELIKSLLEDEWKEIDRENPPLKKVWLYNKATKDKYLGMLVDLDGFPCNLSADMYQDIIVPNDPFIVS